MDIVVIGAGMVGTCTALALADRGHAVRLIDAAAPGRETSYGNAGLIQSEAVEPYAFPREPGLLLEAALRRGPAVSYHAAALPALAPRLAAYWWHSAPQRYARVAAAYAQLIGRALPAHARLIARAGADDLVRRDGYHWIYRSAAAYAEGVRRAERLGREHGVSYALRPAAELRAAEPALQRPIAGAIHWPDPWSVRDPGALVARYAALYTAARGELLQDRVLGLARTGAGWRVHGERGHHDAQAVVIAAGPWSDTLLAPVGLHLPLFVKRGYHQHYLDGATLNAPVLDAERGYVLAPMAQGLRLTTGAEFAERDAPSTPRQLALAERWARGWLALGTASQSEPWRGSRPCTVDMLPVIGPAPGRPGLWCHFGHGHQGFTLGPASAELIAAMIDGEATPIDAAPYAPGRFLR